MLVDYFLEFKQNEVNKYSKDQGIPKHQAAEELVEEVVMTSRGRQVMEEMKRKRHEENTKKKKMPKFVKPKMPKYVQKEKVKPEDAFRELSNLEEVMNVSEEHMEYLDVTVDSGATDSVMDNSKVPSCPVRPSEGSRRGVNYVAAAGKVIPNEGEKRLRVVTEEGHGCNLKMQITAVNKALLSVSKVCDAGHEVTFTNKGGRITHLESGQVTNFQRKDGVYRIRLKVLGENTVFPGKGSKRKLTTIET